MYMPVRYLLAAVFAAALGLSCGSDPASPPRKPDSADLLPLHVGYTWIYASEPHRGSGPPSDHVAEAKQIDGRTYFRIEGEILGSIFGADWVRSTPTAIFIRFAGADDEVILADLAWEPGTEFEFSGSPARRNSDLESVTVPLGKFTQVPSFSYELEVSDGGYSLDLIPGVGIIRAGFGSIAGNSVLWLSEAPTTVP